MCSHTVCQNYCLLLIPAVMTWVAASKKKKLFTMSILTIITALAAMMLRSTTIFMTRMALRITYPGPAKDPSRKAILKERQRGNEIRAGVARGKGVKCKYSSRRAKRANLRTKGLFLGKRRLSTRSSLLKDGKRRAYEAGQQE